MLATLALHSKASVSALRRDSGLATVPELERLHGNARKEKKEKLWLPDTTSLDESDMERVHSRSHHRHSGSGSSIDRERHERERQERLDREMAERIAAEDDEEARGRDVRRRGSQASFDSGRSLHRQNSSGALSTGTGSLRHSPVASTHRTIPASMVPPSLVAAPIARSGTMPGVLGASGHF